MNRLSIIVPSKNPNNLKSCIEAIMGCGERQQSIIVIDDGINSLDFGAVQPYPIHFIQGVKPFVYARNINLGIQAAGNDDVILLNDDALLTTPFGFTLMHDQARRRPEFGIIAAACSNVGNPLQNLQPEFATADHVREELRTLCFTCVLIPRAVLNAVGPLDERFVDYGMDDDDYSLRVRQAGFKLGIYDGCYIDHGSLTSSYRGGPEAGGDFYPNLRRFIEKWNVDNWGRPREQSPYRHLWA